MPIWFEQEPVATGTRGQVNLSYYLSPFESVGRTATLVWRSPNGTRRVVASLRGTEPIILQPNSGSAADPYPAFEILEADGKVDIVEHQRPEPYFRINRDPEVRRALGLQQ